MLVNRMLGENTGSVFFVTRTPSIESLEEHYDATVEAFENK